MCCHTVSDVTISPQYSHFLCFCFIDHNWKYPLVTYIDVSGILDDDSQLSQYICNSCNINMSCCP